MNGRLDSAAGRFTLDDPRPDFDCTLDVDYYLPRAFSETSPIVLVMHGYKRNSDAYRDAWIVHAEQANFLVLVPRFSPEEYPGFEQYNLASMVCDRGRPRRVEKWAFSVVEHVFEYARRATGSRRTGYRIFGHSAGAQFVHRLLLFAPDARVEAAVAANSGWYTMPTFERDFPYGLGNSPATGRQLQRAFGTRLVILLGGQDTNRRDAMLRRTPAALAQGEHRVERGKNFFHLARQNAERGGAVFRWHLRVVPDAGHQHRKMAPVAARLLAGPSN